MADKVKFTQNQRLALDISKKQNLLVSASAGTGKTTVMVTRIRDLVQNKRAELEKMLVVTFTRLAASEMKEKLFNLLTESDDDFTLEQSQHIDACSIGTIHSFCADVVREYFYVVGIDPNFAILEERDSKLLFERATDTVFEKYYRENSDLCDVVEKFCTDREDSTLRKNVKELHKLFSCVESLSDWFEQTFAFYDTQKILEYFNRSFIAKTQKLKQNLSSLLIQMGSAGLDGCVKRLETIRTTLTATDKVDLQKNIQSILETKIPNKNKKDEEIFSCDFDTLQNLLCIQDKLVDDVKKLIDEAKEISLVLQNGEFDKTCEDFCRFLVKLAEEVEKEFALAKKEKNVADFSDLEKMTLKILRNFDTAEQVRQRYDYVFVDEYQDVNGIQEQILQLVAKPNSLFAVGDVKQSIYGFRQASPEIFADKAKQYALDEQNNKVVYMNDNFRCNGQIADFVNEIFKNVMTEQFGKADYFNTGMLVAHSDGRICDQKPAVEVIHIKKSKTKKVFAPDKIYDPTEQSAEEFCDGRAEGKFIADKIKALIGKKKEDGSVVGLGDIVILRRSIKSDAVDIYKQLLREGIPAVIKLEGDVSIKEISDLLAFFKVLDNNYDDYALAQTLLSCIGGFEVNDLAILAENNEQPTLWQKMLFYAEQPLSNKEIKQKCTDFLRLTEKYGVLKSTLKVGQLLLELFKETQYEKYVLALPNGQLRRTRLFSFVGTISALSLAEVLECSFSEEDFSAGSVFGDAVRIMTVHASKGLEFDVVFLSGLDSKFSSAKDSGNIILNKDYGLAVRYSANGEKLKTLREYFVAERIKKREREEELRLLYVGATRAKRKLICIAVKEEALQKPFFDASQATEMFDWLPLQNQTADGKKLFEQQTVLLDHLDCAQETAQAVLQTQSQNIDEELLEQYKKHCAWQYPRKAQLDLPLKVVSSKLDETKSLRLTESAEEDSQAQAVYLADGESLEKTDSDTILAVDKAQLGKAYHKIFETCDLYDVNLKSLQNTVDTLVEKGWVDQSVAQKIDLNSILKTLASRQFVELIADGKCFREIPFLTTLPYDELFGEGFDDEIMLQGVVDLLVIKQNSAIVVDFKVTGRSDLIKERYQKQLNSYKLAVEKCLKIPAQAVVVSVLDGKIIKF